MSEKFVMIEYIGRRTADMGEFGTGECPSGAAYAVMPGKPFAVAEFDAGFLVKQTDPKTNIYLYQAAKAVAKSANTAANASLMSPKEAPELKD